MDVTSIEWTTFSSNPLRYHDESGNANPAEVLRALDRAHRARRKR